MLQITIEDNMGTMLNSEYGRINYHQWCLKEMQRLANAGIFSEIRSKKTKSHGITCSLWVEVGEELERSFKKNFRYDNPQVWTYKRKQLYAERP